MEPAPVQKQLGHGLNRRRALRLMARGFTNFLRTRRDVRRWRAVALLAGRALSSSTPAGAFLSASRDGAVAG